MSFTGLSIGFVMLHTSPLDTPGTKDSGGMNVVVRAQALALAEQGHDVRIYTRRSSEDGASTVELAPGLRVILLDAGPRQLLSKAEHEELIGEFAQSLSAHLHEDPVHILHSEHWLSGLAALDAATQHNVPLVHSYHSIAAPAESPLGEGERPESAGRLAGEVRLAQEADHIVAVSRAERETIISRLGGANEQITVVPLGVDTTVFHPCSTPECAEQREWIGSGGRAEVIVVGRMHPLKGFDVAIDAVAAVPEAIRPTLRLVGAPPPDGDGYARELHRAVAEQGLLNTTSFDGALRRSELAERLRRATVLLVPSHTETFGLVALEAAASGVPVIARNTGGLRESVVDGVTGVLVADDAPQTWARAITALIDDGATRERMSAAAIDFALTHRWNDSAEQLARVYHAVLHRGI